MPGAGGLMAYDVFISYSHQDKLTADAVCATLEAQGVRCWIAPRDITPGQEWGQAIIQAIGGARIMVVVFSHHSNESPQVMREVERAVHAGLAVLPFRIEDVAPSGSLEYFLSSMHWLDALSEDREAHILSLANSIRAILDGEARAIAPVQGSAGPGSKQAPQADAPAPGPRFRLIAAVMAAVVGLLLYLGQRDFGSDGETTEAGRARPVVAVPESPAATPSGAGEMTGKDEQSSDMITGVLPDAGELADAGNKGPGAEFETSPPAPVPAPAPMARATTPDPEPPAQALVAPPANSFMADTTAGYEYAYVIQAAVEAELADQAFALVDPASSPQRSIRELVRFGVATTARVIDTRELKFYGRSQTQYTVTLTLQVTDLTRGAIVVGPINATVQYTSINAEENLQQTARELARRAAAEMRRRIA